MKFKRNAVLCMSTVVGALLLTSGYASFLLLHAQYSSTIEAWLYLAGGQRVAFLDPTSLEDPTCRGLAVSTALMATFIWGLHSRELRSLHRGLAILLVAIIVGWFAPRRFYGPSLTFTVLLLAIQGFVLLWATSTVTTRKYSLGQHRRFTIAELTMLTTVIAVAILLWQPITKSIWYNPTLPHATQSLSNMLTPNWWLLCLGTCAGINSFLWGLPMIVRPSRRAVSVASACLFAVVAGASLLIGYRYSALFWPPNRPYGKGLPLSYYRGYIYWLEIHGLLQLSLCWFVRLAQVQLNGRAVTLAFCLSFLTVTRSEAEPSGEPEDSRGSCANGCRFARPRLPVPLSD